ncbi:Probable sugar phosphate/phosphate translocator At1g06470 [Linum grandiflorum]
MSVHGDEGSPLGNGSEKDRLTPMEIENGLPFKEHLSDPGDDRSDSLSNFEIVSPKSKSPVSAVDVLKTLFFILVWYTFSTFLTLYNKTLLGDHLGRFPAPLLMNAFHFGMQAVMSTFITWYWSHKFETTVAMSWRDYFVRVVPTALGTAMDVNLSNASLVFISVTFATMCKSAAPIFLILFAFAFRYPLSLIALYDYFLCTFPFPLANLNLSSVARETEFEFWGFVFVMLAAVMSGFRWSMTQILLQVLTEYILISVTSAVTVTIAGVVKEAVTIVVAVFYFHDKFTWLKGVGLVIIMVGVGLFNWYKYEKLQQVQREAIQDDSARSSTETIPAKYVILEEADDQEDET